MIMIKNEKGHFQCRKWVSPHILEKGAIYQYLPVKKGYVGILHYQDLTKI